MKKICFILLGCIFLMNCSSIEFPQTIEINEGWEFKADTSTTWFPAQVPGLVHTDLFANKLIEDPFVKNNEAKLQGISNTNWEYKTTFSLDKKIVDKKHLELNFKGLDTYASVYLNGSLILEANNAFREWKVEVKSLLKSENEMRIVFEKTATTEKKEKAKLKYELPEGNRIFTRKAQFQYGWDWGPKFNSCGIWRKIELNAWGDIKLESVNLQQKELTEDIAKLQANISIRTSKEKNVEVLMKVNGKEHSTFPLKLSPSQTQYFLPFNIKNPKLWWPHNVGDPYQYSLSFVIKKGGQIVDSILINKGLRTVELMTEKDTKGSSFYFKINGKSIYAKGANYIPQNSFQNKVTDSNYEKLLNDVVNSNMNMLRVWGGGIYESDLFYELCDKKGILIWQDFMFACAMYPGDSAFLNNVKQEAIDNVIRLQNHSSIVLWCGNNESSEGWKRWGWQSGKSESQKVEIWNNYLTLFDTILPNIVQKHGNRVPYWESSPKYGRGNPKYKTEGDAHDWWIWHDGYPFEHLEKNVPRFMSEFGFQSFPSYEAINYSNQNDSVAIFSNSFSSHQKHSRGFQTIEEYRSRDFPNSEKDEDYVYVSQLLQAYGITKGIEAHRRAKPYNMGTLYWQLNDCWPAISWSSIDFLGNWKALQYKAKKSFKNVLLSSIVENDTMKIYVINDEFISHSGELSIQIMDYYGNIKWETSKAIQVKENSSEIYYSLPLHPLGIKHNEVVVKASFNSDSSLFYLAKPKELKLIKSTITQKITQTEGGFIIQLSSTTLQKDVFLYSDKKGHFDDNFFDLLPGSVKSIRFKSSCTKLEDIKIKTLNGLGK